MSDVWPGSRADETVWGAPVPSPVGPVTGTAEGRVRPPGTSRREDTAVRPRAPLVPVSVALTRRERRRIRMVERFDGPRIRSRVGPWRRLRSVVLLLLLGLLLAAVLAALFSAIVAGLALAFHHVSSG